MGAWGAGLYSDDFARDLKPMIAAAARLPIPTEALLDLIRAQHGGIAADPSDEDHTAFWLVLADTLGRLGIDCPEARERALAIIDGGQDLARCAALEMAPADLRKRAAMLAALRETLARGPAPGRKRAMLRGPQPFLMELGDCLVFPTSRGQGINAYFPSRDAQPDWRQDGWGAGIVCELGRAFGHLAWYRFCVLGHDFRDKPGLDEVRRGRFGPGLSAGTCSPLHFKRVALEKIGALPVRPGAILAAVPELLTQVRPPEKAAILDVSLCNNLCAIMGSFRGVPVASVLEDGP